MSLKKKAAVGLGAAFWLACSEVAFVAISDTKPENRSAFDKTRNRRIALVASGPLFCSMIPFVLVADTIMDFCIDSKKQRESAMPVIKNFLFDPPKKS